MHEEQCCQENGGQECCGQECSSEQCCQGYSGMDEKVWAMFLVKIAKAELIKEKIKKKLEATEGKKFDKMADILVDAMMKQKKSKMEQAHAEEEAREKIEELWHGHEEE